MVKVRQVLRSDPGEETVRRRAFKYANVSLIEVSKGLFLLLLL